MSEVKKATGIKKVIDPSVLMAASHHPMKEEVNALRDLILAADPKLTERVKWNVPSYYYKKDMAAFNLRQEKFVQLIMLFPDGLVDDPAGIMEGTWTDRREIRFHNMEEVHKKSAALTEIIREWIRIQEKIAKS